ncbi:MAG: hypothetical protein AABY11_04005, partial [archaeon]
MQRGHHPYITINQLTAGQVEWLSRKFLSQEWNTESAFHDTTPTSIPSPSTRAFYRMANEYKKNPKMKKEWGKVFDRDVMKALGPLFKAIDRKKPKQPVSLKEEKRRDAVVGKKMMTFLAGGANGTQFVIDLSNALGGTAKTTAGARMVRILSENLTLRKKVVEKIDRLRAQQKSKHDAKKAAGYAMRMEMIAARG